MSFIFIQIAFLKFSAIKSCNNHCNGIKKYGMMTAYFYKTSGMAVFISAVYENIKTQTCKILQKITKERTV